MAITVGIAADPAKTSGTSSVVVTDEVAEMLGGLWDHMQTPDGAGTVGTVTTESEAERESFAKQARRWASDNGLRFRVVRNSETETGLMFRLSVPLTDEQKAAIEQEREAKRAARAKAGKGTPGRKPGRK